LSCSPCGHRCRGRYDTRTCRARDLSAGGVRIYVQFERWRVHGPRRRGVYVERLDWLAKNPRFTQRFAMHVGALCREMTNATVAQAERLHNSTVRASSGSACSSRSPVPACPAAGDRGGRDHHLGGARLPHRRQRSRSQAAHLGRAGRAAPKPTGTSSLPRWAPKRRRASSLPRWTGGRLSHLAHAPCTPGARDLRQVPYRAPPRRGARRRPPQRGPPPCCQGQRYTLLSHRENLSLDVRRSLTKLLKANKRLNTADLRKESLGQLLDYQPESGARAFFTRWTQRLTWQRLTPYEKFAAMIERH
jgi:transposase